MFCGTQHGKAEEAIRWHCSILEDSRIVKIDRYGPGEAEPEGSVRVAEFEIGGHPVKAIDSAGHLQRVVLLGLPTALVSLGS